jgi:hypothetical protein
MRRLLIALFTILAIVGTSGACANQGGNGPKPSATGGLGY